MSTLIGEARIQAIVIGHLRGAGIPCVHIANERKASARQHARLRQAGVEAGMPDILIFRAPPYRGLGPDGELVQLVGAALELKTATGEDGAKARGRVSPEQRAWLDRLAAEGWATAVCYGSAAALAQLRVWGYL